MLLLVLRNDRFPCQSTNLFHHFLLLIGIQTEDPAPGIHQNQGLDSRYLQVDLLLICVCLLSLSLYLFSISSPPLSPYIVIKNIVLHCYG